jgi:hypothetical protein
MRLVTQGLSCFPSSLPFPSLPPLIAVRSLSHLLVQLLLPTLPSSRPPLPRPLSTYFTSLHFLHRLPSLPFFHRPTFLLHPHQFFSSFFRQHPPRLSVRPNTPTSRTTIYLKSCLYLTAYRQTLLPNPILVPIAFWFYQVRKLPLYPCLESSL